MSLSLNYTLANYQTLACRLQALHTYSYNSLHAKMVILSSYSTFIATHTGQDKLVKTGTTGSTDNYKVSNEMEDPPIH